MGSIEFDWMGMLNDDSPILKPSGQKNGGLSVGNNTMIQEARQCAYFKQAELVDVPIQKIVKMIELS